MNVKIISKTIISLVVALVFLYALFLMIVTWPLSEISLNKAGLFGDSFGILTSLFSGLAFGGIIITILLQREELKLQRKELKLQRKELVRNRKEMARTASAQENSEEWFALQSRMLALSAMSNMIELRNKTGQVTDRKMIDKLYGELSRLLEKTKEKY